MPGAAVLFGKLDAHAARARPASGRARAGKCCVSSHSRTCGRISVSANSRTLRRSSSCSSVSRKSIDQNVIRRTVTLSQSPRRSDAVMMRIRRLACDRVPTLVLARAVVRASPRRRSPTSTAFLGANTTPANRPVKGFAVGVGLLVVGFEFEYADTSDDPPSLAPSLKTGMGNVLLQTPVAIFGLPAVLHDRRRRLPARRSARTRTRASALNTGGGVKISLVGPLRLRVDYRVFKLGSGALYLASAPHLRRTESEILTTRMPLLGRESDNRACRGSRSFRLTMFCPARTLPRTA